MSLNVSKHVYSIMMMFGGDVLGYVDVDVGMVEGENVGNEVAASIQISFSLSHMQLSDCCIHSFFVEIT